MSREPIPPPVPRTDALGILQRELWIAQDAGEQLLAARLQARIDELSAQSSPTPPRRETTAADSPRRETTGAKPKPAPKPKPKPQSRRSPRVPR